MIYLTVVECRKKIMAGCHSCVSFVENLNEKNAEFKDFKITVNAPLLLAAGRHIKAIYIYTCKMTHFVATGVKFAV